MKWKILLVALIGLFFTERIYGESLESSDFPSLISSLNVQGPLQFCGEAVPLNIQDAQERFEKELLLSLWDRAQVILWLKRSRRYLPDIEKILKDQDMPDDLKYVCIAESALRPHAGSSKGAIGFWQFMVASGRRYGLVINDRIDERRNLFASTRAAIGYLKELYERFGSWTLAAAAYNMGEEGLMAEILEQETKDYYQLYLPLETQRFLFRILSVKLILSDPKRYGFDLSEEDYYLPIPYDKVQVDCFQEIPIRIIAQAAKTHFKVIKDLNPEIRGHAIPPGSHHILIPQGALKDFPSRYQQLIEKFLKAQKERIYVIQKGDNLSSIAERFGIPVNAILIWNRLDLKRPLQPGQKILIYRKDILSEGKDFD
ncbi:MAG: transglycosylase SLT domain-containing protein [Pseudomonadota bacterium]